MNKLEKYKNEREAGKLAIALARFTYFGDTVLSQSTLTGRNNMPALDREKMASLKRDIRSVFLHLSGGFPYSLGTMPTSNLRSHETSPSQVCH